MYLASVAVSSLSHPPLSPSPAGAGLRGCWRSRTRPRLRCCSSSEPWRPTAARFVAVRCGAVRVCVFSSALVLVSVLQPAVARQRVPDSNGGSARGPLGRTARQPAARDPLRGRQEAAGMRPCSVAWHSTAWLDLKNPCCLLSVVYCLLSFTGAGVQCFAAGMRPNLLPSVVPSRC